MTDRFKRPGTMTGEDRELAAIERRRAELERRRASSEPAADAFNTDDDHFTPVSTVIERAADLTDRERNLLRYVWTHTANMEMRARARSDSQDTALLARRVDDIEGALDEKFGRSRKNGEFSTLKDRLEKAEGRRWQVTMWLAGLLVTIVTSAFVLGKWIGSVESDVATLKARSARHVSPPAYPATKEGTP